MVHVAVVLVVLILVSLAGALQARVNRGAILVRILDRVGGTLTRGWFRDQVTGEHGGREFNLIMGGAPSPRRSGSYTLSASLKLQHAPDVKLRVRRDQGLAAVEKALGLVRDIEVAGGELFDRRYLVEANRAPDQSPLADADVRIAVDRILSRWDLDEIRIQDGWLTVLGDSRRIGQAMLHELLYELEVLAHAYDRRPALEIGLRERFFWIGGGDSHARCPYCHDTFKEDEDMSSCAECNTLLHPDCHAENGGCPILGCGGRGAEPLRPLRVPEK